MISTDRSKDILKSTFQVFGHGTDKSSLKNPGATVVRWRRGYYFLE
jgi:hypothetical protein